MATIGEPGDRIGLGCLAQVGDLPILAVKHKVNAVSHLIDGSDQQTQLTGTWLRYGFAKLAFGDQPGLAGNGIQRAHQYLQAAPDNHHQQQVDATEQQQ